MSIAVFGLPLGSGFPPPQVHSLAVMSVPPPQPTIILPPPQVASIEQKQETIPSIAVENNQLPVDSSLPIESTDHHLIVDLPSATNEPVDETTNNGERETTSVNDEMTERATSGVGLYEDGEIQDVDYEEISSNEETFSDEGDLTEEVNFITTASRSPDGHRQLLEDANLLDRYCWQFNPLTMIDKCQLVSNSSRLRIPDPTATMLQVHCWLLDRCSSSSSIGVVAESSSSPPSAIIIKTEEADGSDIGNDDSAIRQSTSSTPPLDDDLVQAKKSSQCLVGALKSFPLAMDTDGDNSFRDESWVDSMETLLDHLVPGFAYLYWSKDPVEQDVIDSLLDWTVTGLTLTSAVRHVKPDYAIRHLLVGCRLAGLVTGQLVLTEVAGSNKLAHSTLQIQHLLLDLLDLPIITTPLRLALIRALDQSTRGVTSGLLSFFTLPSNGCHDESDDIKPSSPDLGHRSNTPYERASLALMASKNSRTTSALQCLLNKVHAYDILVDFDETVQQFKKCTEHDSGLADVVDSASSCKPVMVSLNKVKQLFEHATDLMANPRSTLPCSLVLTDSDRRQLSDPFPFLFHLMDHCHLLDNLVWLLEFVTITKDESPTKNNDPWPLPARDTLLSTLVAFLSSLLPTSSSNNHHLQGLTWLAGRPETVKRLLTVCLSPSSRGGEDHDLLRLGLELACKLEALRCIDSLLALTRRIGNAAGSSNSPSIDDDDPVLYTSLFDLARLGIAPSSHLLDFSPLSTHGSPTSGTASIADAANRIWAASSPSWLADLLTSDDLFAPLLLLLESMAGDRKSSDDTTPSPVCSGSNEKKGGEGDTKSGGVSNGQNATTTSSTNQSSTSATGIRGSIRQLVSSPIQPTALLTSIVLTTLRHADNMSYLNKYGWRLAKLVGDSSHHQDEESTVLHSFVNFNTSFSQSASPYLGWLNSVYQQGQRSLTNSALDQTDSRHLFKQLISQLIDSQSDLVDSLDALVADIDPTTTSIPPRFGSRPIPPRILLILRLLRRHLLPDQGHHLVLARSFNLIELVAANSLTHLGAIVKHLATFYIASHQRRLSSRLNHKTSPSNNATSIATNNANNSLVLAMLEVSLDLLQHILSTLIHVQGSSFADQSLVPALCLAYSCSVYAADANPNSLAGPQFDQIKRIRSNALNSILAFVGTEPDCIEDFKKSTFTAVLREVIKFIISAPCHYLPGVKLLTEFLPLPLPIEASANCDLSFESSKNSLEQQIKSQRQSNWIRRCCALSSELCGLIELIGSTSPSCNPLHSALVKLTRRLADLGYECATFLASNCLDSMLSTWQDSYRLYVKQKSNEGTASKSIGENTEGISSIGIQLAPANSLLLPSSAPSIDNSVNDHLGQTSLQLTPSPTIQHQDVVFQPDLLLVMFGGDDKFRSLTASLRLLELHLSIPGCRLALISLLKEKTPSSPTPDQKGGGQKVEEKDSTKNRYRQFLLGLSEDLLLLHSDKNCYLEAQTTLLNCLGLMLNTKLALTGFGQQATGQGQEQSNNFAWSEWLPDSTFIQTIVCVLFKHLGHLERDLSTLPLASDPIISLTSYDYGFSLVRNALNQSTSDKSRPFASLLLQRVNDCFSADSPDCQATLASCLCLLQSLRTGRSELPLTFERDRSSKRTLFLSNQRLRELLGWSVSGGGDVGKPVRDLHALLEMLTDDEPSLEYLRSGMKNLLELLSNEFDLRDSSIDNGAAIDSSTINQQLPSPRPLDLIFSTRPYLLPIDKDTCSSIKGARKRLFDELADCQEVDGSSKTSRLVDCNLDEIAVTYCNNLAIKDELTLYGRLHRSSDVAIRHQKRRRGQSSIIETGKSTKKFVAPMRGRGFVLKSSSAASLSSSSNSFSSTGGGAGGRDSFRGRSLNTSRPPSLHVDDFTKLVTDDNTIEIDHSHSRDTRNMRGRGFSRGGGSSFRGRPPFTSSNLINPMPVIDSSGGPVRPTFRQTSLLPLTTDHHYLQQPRPNR